MEDAKPHLSASTRGAKVVVDSSHQAITKMHRCLLMYDMMYGYDTYIYIYIYIITVYIKHNIIYYNII